jgi:outer membrane protein TolC
LRAVVRALVNGEGNEMDERRGMHGERQPTPLPLRAIVAWALITAILVSPGCTRKHYRLSADEDAYSAIKEKTAPPWPLVDYTIDPKPESRFFDPDNPDFPPMPPDDPAAHKLMHCIDGKCGDGCWHCDGDTPYVENPAWMNYLPWNDQGQIVIDLQNSVLLGLLHSPLYQRELEDLYLSALDVTFERFRFDVQFALTNQTLFTADGPLRTGAGGNSSSRLETNTSLEGRKLFANGAELIVGLANSIVWQFSGPDSNFTTTLLDFSLLQPLLRGGGRARVLERLTIAERTLLANVRQMEQYRRGFYVNLVTGRDAGQGPQRRGGLLGGAGLSGFTGVGAGGFGQVGNIATGQQGAGGGGTAGGAGAAQAGGYLGLLQDAQQIRNQEGTVAALADSLAQLDAAYEAGRIDKFQVDLARQALYNTRSQLMINRANYEAALDRFKALLGLPPHLELRIDDPLLSPFQLIDAAIPPLQNRLTELQGRVGSQIIALREAQAGADAGSLDTLRNSITAIRQSFEQVIAIQREAAGHVPTVRVDVTELDSAIPERVRALEKLQQSGFSGGRDSDRVTGTTLDAGDGQSPEAAGMTPEEARDVREERTAERDEIDDIIADLRDLPAKLARDLQTLAQQFRAVPREFQQISDELAWLEENAAQKDSPEYRTRLNTLLGVIPDRLVDLSSDILELSLIQARAKSESVTLLPLDLEADEALLIASRQRYDWMNARAALVDVWRLIEFNANDLLSTLNLTFSGDVRNLGDNPVDFRGTTGRLQVGAQFDAPINRMAERNNYRQALIEYQRARRDYYTFIDRVSQALRANLRSIDLNQANFELRRAAIRVAIDQVEITRLRLRQPPQPGVATTFSPTVARDLVSALSDLQNVQNDFLSVWVNYEVERLNLDFNMGTMELDPQGLWIDPGTAIGTTRLDPYSFPHRWNPWGFKGECADYGDIWMWQGGDVQIYPDSIERRRPRDGRAETVDPPADSEVLPAPSNNRGPAATEPNEPSLEAPAPPAGESTDPPPMPSAALLRAFKTPTRTAQTVWRRAGSSPIRIDSAVQPASHAAPAESPKPSDAVIRIKLTQ